MMQGMKRFRTAAVSVLIVVSLGLAFIAIHKAKDVKALDLFKGKKGQARIKGERPRSFTDLAKRLKPSVINIRSTKLVKHPGSGFGTPFGPRSPFRDFFGDEFFDRFFPHIPNREFEQKSLGSGLKLDVTSSPRAWYRVSEMFSRLLSSLSRYKYSVPGPNSNKEESLNPAETVILGLMSYSLLKNMAVSRARSGSRSIGRTMDSVPYGRRVPGFILYQILFKPNRTL